MVAILYNCQYLVRSQIEYACNDAYCPLRGNCPKFHCKGEDMKTIHNATKCGCCHKCVKELSKIFLTLTFMSQFIAFIQWVKFKILFFIL
jgi:hypothetical protein